MDIIREKLILRVISLQASDDEKTELNAWLNAHPNHKEEFEDLKIMLSQAVSDSEGNADNPGAVAFAKLEAKKSRHKRLASYVGQAITALTLLSAMVAMLWQFHMISVNTNREGLVFRGASFVEIVKLVEERMNVEILVESPAILTCRFTGAFPANATAEDILAGITYRSQISFHILDGKYVIRGSGCGSGQFESH